MRVCFFIIFVVTAFFLGVCAKKAFYSTKSIGRSVAGLLCALIPPVLGNAVIIISGNRTVSTVGYYIYFLGMNGVMLNLINFTHDYCMLPSGKSKMKIFAYVLLAIDTVQLLCNLIWGHAFDTEAYMADGFTYYRLIPLAGQSFHRFIDYGILAVNITAFFIYTINSPRISAERYAVILAIMLVTTVWETFYIFSRTPIDRSMLGFGFFGFMVYYFSLYYRPMRLLDSMLSHIASELPEALYFFDSMDKCIWANRMGIELVGIENNAFEVASVRLKKLYGEYKRIESKQYEIRKDGEVKSYVISKKEITDEAGRLIGSFLSVRDNTSEQMTLREEVYKATHDPLTDVYNRAGYNVLISKMELWKTIMLLLDGDCFKSVNDTYGHEVGDKVLQRIADTVRHYFRSEDYVCRIGGDEFVVLMVHSNSDQKELIINRIKRINEELQTPADGLPAITLSFGIAHGRNAADSDELFEHADKALYETKSKGKNGFTFYEDLVPEKD
ncbi:MAG: GGDEF domain-containing protein [Clostridia bacterium]|nr:GGDEF domain-containing protein [Clostridia bacterium]